MTAVSSIFVIYSEFETVSLFSGWVPHLGPNYCKLL